MSVQQFEQEVLKAHNVLRAEHGAAPLRLSSKLNQVAREWAQHLLAIKRMEHRQNSGYGENIYWSSGAKRTGADTVQSWYDEIKLYDWSRPAFRSGTGHFTQLVWKDSTELGVGLATRGNEMYVVCNYNPPGNYANRFAANVLPKSGQRQSQRQSQSELATVQPNRLVTRSTNVSYDVSGYVQTFQHYELVQKHTKY
ncbi:CG16995 [Drosophila busckii]|uniref:CG16995 n=1 Tax=Drosophila busckii TaxID=30019 RepID=A0A0M4ES86_DROBS|nr:Golgi-associated plant pathogenesis-related protein 1 [Drosophila busckii]ALC40150.1 CG16995 [Drosophila busckii]